MADICPKCGHAGVSGERCPSCGVVVAAYRVYLEKLHRRPGSASAGAGRGTGVPVTEATAAVAASVQNAAAGAVAEGVAPAPSSVAVSSAAAPVAAPASHRVRFHGDTGTLFGIQMMNALLIILTLGVYFFWARVRVRRYLLSETELDGDRFEYHGTGREVLRGGTRALLLFGLPLLAAHVIGFVARDTPGVDVLTGVVTSGIVVTFFAVAIVGARRYRLSRTSWRGIRFSFRGDAGKFIKMFIAGSFIAVFTFGLYVPIFFTRQYAYLTSNTWFGSRKFNFDGRPQALFWPYVKMLGLAIPTLGIYFFWYLAAQQRFFWGHTTFGGARFRSTVTGGGLFVLYAVNFLVLLLTVGLAWPWVVIRKWRYRIDHLRLDGPLGLEDVVQQPQDASATADSIAGFIGLDFG